MVIGKKCSEIVHVWIAVPQGSILRPILFTNYINDLIKFYNTPDIYFTHADSIKYADKTNVIVETINNANIYTN